MFDDGFGKEEGIGLAALAALLGGGLQAGRKIPVKAFETALSLISPTGRKVTSIADVMGPQTLRKGGKEYVNDDALVAIALARAGLGDRAVPASIYGKDTKAVTGPATVRDKVEWLGSVPRGTLAEDTDLLDNLPLTEANRQLRAAEKQLLPGQEIDIYIDRTRQLDDGPGGQMRLLELPPQPQVLIGRARNKVFDPAPTRVIEANTPTYGATVSRAEKALRGEQVNLASGEGFGSSSIDTDIDLNDPETLQKFLNDFTSTSAKNRELVARVQGLRRLKNYGGSQKEFIKEGQRAGLARQLDVVEGTVAPLAERFAKAYGVNEEEALDRVMKAYAFASQNTTKEGAQRRVEDAFKLVRVKNTFGVDELDAADYSRNYTPGMDKLEYRKGEGIQADIASILATGKMKGKAKSRATYEALKNTVALPVADQSEMLIAQGFDPTDVELYGSNLTNALFNNPRMYRKLQLALQEAMLGKDSQLGRTAWRFRPRFAYMDPSTWFDPKSASQMQTTAQFRYRPPAANPETGEIL